MEFKKLIVVVFKFYLGTNLFLSLYWAFELKKLNKLYEHRNEFKKVRVLVDTIYMYRFGASTDPHEDYYKILYSKSLRDSLLVEDINGIVKKIIRDKNQNNDSIHVWHHPTLEDSYAMPSHTRYEDSFDKSYIRSSIILLFIAIITLVYLLFKYIKKRWKKKEF
ncbi:hypothetical protein TMP248_120006 [Tenacibaculum maritimum]|uniref:hypothetical protein n=1 Tax=Tenacibaculum maritimum TaxID=107401 RepID=UPI0012E44A17|nr:hypothetical protein [Tenacibaculum maritimum]CAA0165004.1 hypothetical protein TMP248_120006 [Tenacibaculum maritimum]CAA0244408.1 hypothetical protein NACSLCCMFF_60108 [Tenacibaculum maritimum]